MLHCDIAAIKAVAEVESNGNAFTVNNRLICLFEGHLFYKWTKGRFAKSHPTLCYKSWVKSFYKKDYDDEYTERFSVAFRLDAEAAMKATSWGAFQILGEHYIRLGFASVGDMLDFLKRDEDNHLTAFAKFVETDTRLLRALQQRDWATFARIYNGPAYKKNNYDTKLAKAYAKFNK